MKKLRFQVSHRDPKKNESGDGRAIVWARVRAGVGSELGVSKKFLSPSGPSWGTQGVGGSKNRFIE